MFTAAALAGELAEERRRQPASIDLGGARADSAKQFIDQRLTNFIKSLAAKVESRPPSFAIAARELLGICHG